MLRVISVWTGKPGSPWYSTLYFAGTGSTEAQDAKDNVLQMMNAFLQMQVGPINADTDEFVASVSPTNGEVTGGFTVTPGHVGIGSGSSTMVAGATQALVTLRTGQYAGGREIKGKFYLPGLKSSYLDGDGRFVPSLATAVNAEFQALLADGPDLLVWSRKNKQAYQVSSATTSLVPAVLRTRRD